MEWKELRFEEEIITRFVCVCVWVKLAACGKRNGFK